ncbi:MAG: HAMP domain-containing histidine kinase [Leptolyngbya sp. SIO1E4]|nr:HAMP domain-containing histidine kinase [Leptolyngbya sp. SIO1E4]
MNFSRSQQWLTVGCGAVLMALLGTGILAYQAIIYRIAPSVWEEEEVSEYFYLNGLFVAITDAEVSQQLYLESGEEAALSWYYEQLEMIDIYLEGLFETYGEIEEIPAYLEEESVYLEGDFAYIEALMNLEIAIEEFIFQLEDGIEQYDAEPLDMSTQLELAQLISEARLDVQLALQMLLEESSWEHQWEVTDASLDLNRDLWFTSITVGLGCIAIGILYGGVMQTLRRRENMTTDLRDRNQQLSQTLDTKMLDLQQAKTALRTELIHRQELETTCQEIEQAKELTDLKLNFFSLASHELRTPLSSILVSAQLLDNPNANWSEDKRSRNLRRIQSAAKTMAQLLADILLLTRAEAGKLEFNPQTIELQDFCQRLVEEVKFNTQAQHRISVQQQGECSYACLDEKLLRALLMSLLTNAIKYSPQESEIKFTIWGENGRTRFQVSDQGIGISPGDQQHLFESFRRGQNVKTISGTGLGLAVVKKCLDLHGGSIEVESQVSVGTTFTVDIPWISEDDLEGI